MPIDVSIHLNRFPIESRRIAPIDRVRLGEAPDAAVSFPGADLELREAIDGPFVLEHGGGAEPHRWPIVPGLPLRFGYGSVDVVLSLVDTRESRPFVPPRRRRGPDFGVLVTTLAVALAGGFVDATSSFLQRKDPAHLQVRRLIEEFGEPGDHWKSRALERDAPPNRTAHMHPVDPEGESTEPPPATEDAPPPVRDEERPPATFRSVE